MSDDLIKAQEALIHILLKHDDALKDFANSPIKKQHFHPRYRLLVEAILDFESRGVKVTRAGYRDYVEKCNKNKLEIIGEEGVYNDVYTTAGVRRDDMPVYMDKVREGYVRNQAVNHIDAFTKAQQQDPIYAAKDLIDKLGSTINDVDNTSNISFNTIDDKAFIDQWWQELAEKETSDNPKIICGIPEIDECMGVGFHPETLTIICADVGGLKSTMMLNISLNVFKLNGRDVLFVPLEMPKNRIFDKIISRETGIPFNKFQNPKGTPSYHFKDKLTEENKERVRQEIEKWRALSHRFAILETGERTKVSIIQRQIVKHLSHHNPCLVVVDYIANLLPDRTHQGRHDLEIGDMLKDLIKMGKPGVTTKDGFAVLTGAQLGREALKRLRTQKDQSKQVLGSEDIQGSHQYSADATNIFGQIKDPAQPGEKLHLVCIKSRYGKTTFGPQSLNKAVLSVKPDVSLIESYNNAVYKPGDEDLLVKVQTDKPSVSNNVGFGLDDLVDDKDESADGLEGFF